MITSKELIGVLEGIVADLKKENDKTSIYIIKVPTSEDVRPHLNLYTEREWLVIPYNAWYVGDERVGSHNWTCFAGQIVREGLLSKDHPRYPGQEVVLYATGGFDPKFKITKTDPNVKTKEVSIGTHYTGTSCTCHYSKVEWGVEPYTVWYVDKNNKNQMTVVKEGITKSGAGIVTYKDGGWDYTNQVTRENPRPYHHCAEKDWPVEPYKAWYNEKALSTGKFAGRVVKEGICNSRNMTHCGKEIVIYEDDGFDPKEIITTVDPTAKKFEPYAAVVDCTVGRDPVYSAKAKIVKVEGLNSEKRPYYVVGLVQDTSKTTRIEDPISAIRVIHKCLGSKSPLIDKATVKAALYCHTTRIEHIDDLIRKLKLE